MEEDTIHVSREGIEQPVKDALEGKMIDLKKVLCDHFGVDAKGYVFTLRPAALENVKFPSPSARKTKLSELKAMLKYCMEREQSYLNADKDMFKYPESQRENRVKLIQEQLRIITTRIETTQAEIDQLLKQEDLTEKMKAFDEALLDPVIQEKVKTMFK